MRLTIRFDAGAERYRWLNTSLFIAKGLCVPKTLSELMT